MICFIRYSLLLFFSFCCLTSTIATGIIEAGEAYLSLDELESDIVTLKGEAFFYRDTLCDLDAIKSDSMQHSFTTIGSAWHQEEGKYSKFENQGYGTYYFKLHIPEVLVGKLFIIKTNDYIPSAAKIFVNGEACGGNGMVGTSLDDPLYVPSCQIEVCTFIPQTTQLDIVIQCSNFNCGVGSVFNTLRFGLAEYMASTRHYAVFEDLFVIICLIVMACYHLVLYGVDRVSKSPLYYFLLCLFVAVHLSLSREMPFFIFFPDFPFAYHYILQSILPFFISSFVFLFLSALYPGFFSQKLIVGNFVIAIIFSLVFILGDTTWRFYTQLVFHKAMLLLVIYGFKLCFGLIKKKMEFSVMFLISYLIFILCIVSDVLNTFEIISTIHMLPVGVLFFMFFLAGLYGKRAATLHSQLVLFTSDLQQKRNELEQNVSIRNEELVHSLDELNQAKTFQAEVTTLIANELKNSIEPLLYFDKIDEKEYSKYKHSGYKMLNMVQNMLQIYRFNNNRVVIRRSQFDVIKVIDGVIKNFMYLIKTKDLKVEVIQHDKYDLYADVQVFELVFLNLLSNRLQWSPQGGLVQIRLKACGPTCLKVSISRQGEPLNEEDKKKVLAKSVILKDYKTAIGKKFALRIHLCRLALDAHDGELGIEVDDASPPLFWFRLPGVSLVDNNNTVTNNSEKALTDDDCIYLRPFVNSLLELQFYDLSKIEDIVSQIPKKTDGVTQWCDSLIDTCYQVDEVAYNDLLQIVWK